MILKLIHVRQNENSDVICCTLRSHKMWHMGCVHKSVKYLHVCFLFQVWIVFCPQETVLEQALWICVHGENCLTPVAYLSALLLHLLRDMNFTTWQCLLDFITLGAIVGNVTNFMIIIGIFSIPEHIKFSGCTTP